MNNKLTKIIIPVMLITLFLSYICAYAYPSPTSEFYVNDFANVLDSKTESFMLTRSNQLYTASKAQLVVVTIDSLEDEAIEDYSYKLANAWKIGDEKNDSGMLILLSVLDREIRVEVGRGLEGAVNDAKAGRFMDNYAIPYFKEDNFSEGIYNLYNAILKEICIEYNIEGIETVEPQTPEDDFDAGSMLTVTIFTVFILIYLARLKNGHSGGNGGNHTPGVGGWHVGGGFSGGGSFRGSGGGGSFGGGGSSRRF